MLSKDSKNKENRYRLWFDIATRETLEGTADEILLRVFKRQRISQSIDEYVRDIRRRIHVLYGIQIRFSSAEELLIQLHQVGIIRLEALGENEPDDIHKHPNILFQNERFLLKKADENDKTVELWSYERLPFEPNGWLVDMRDALRGAIQDYRADKNKFLHAAFISYSFEHFDMENVLIYNVGPSLFRHLCEHGIILERGFKCVPPSPVHRFSFAPNYHYYGMTNDNFNYLCWIRTKTLAKWTCCHIPGISAHSGPHTFWHAMKKTDIDTEPGKTHSGYYGIDITIINPQEPRFHICDVMKPLLDGVISAFHTFDSDVDDEIVNRLSQRTGEDRQVLTEMLVNEKASLLGKRNHLYIRGDGLQWNPADDNCVLIHLTQTTSPSIKTTSMSGEVFDLCNKDV